METAANSILTPRHYGDASGYVQEPFIEPTPPSSFETTPTTQSINVAIKHYYAAVRFFPYLKLINLFIVTCSINLSVMNSALHIRSLLPI